MKSMIPKHVYERRKEQFSDAVGDKWIQSLQSMAVRITGINDKYIAEKVLYKCIFDDLFAHVNTTNAVVIEADTVACSTKRALQWRQFQNDPTGESLRQELDK